MARPSSSHGSGLILSVPGSFWAFPPLSVRGKKLFPKYSSKGWCHSVLLAWEAKVQRNTFEDLWPHALCSNHHQTFSIAGKQLGFPSWNFPVKPRTDPKLSHYVPAMQLEFGVFCPFFPPSDKTYQVVEEGETWTNERPLQIPSFGKGLPNSEPLQGCSG